MDRRLAHDPDPVIPEFRKAIEFLSATPLEYLERWIASNQVFGDDVRLISVIEWEHSQISPGITQPRYHGEPAEPRDIERHFLAAGNLLPFDVIPSKPDADLARFLRI